MVFLSVISLLKWPPKQSVKVLSRVPKCKKSVICLIEKIYVFDKLPLGMSDWLQFNINEAAIDIK